MKLSPAAWSAVLAGWGIAISWGGIAASGGAKTLEDYATGVSHPDDVIQAISTREIWSGWWPAIDGYRLTTSIRPDIVFGWSATRDDCEIVAAVFPASGTARGVQRMLWRFNAEEWQGPIEVGAESLVRMRAYGTMMAGNNTISFRLPDAHLASPTDTRLISVALRWFKFECGHRRASEIETSSR